jgi:hypothetical protein
MMHTGCEQGDGDKQDVKRVESLVKVVAEKRKEEAIKTVNGANT